MWPLLRLLSVLWVCRLSSGQVAVSVPAQAGIPQVAVPQVDSFLFSAAHPNPILELSEHLTVHDAELQNQHKELGSLQSTVKTMGVKLQNCTANTKGNSSAEEIKQVEQQSEQLESLQKRMKALEDSVRKLQETQTKQLASATQTTAASKETEVLKTVNETEAEQKSQKTELQRQASMLLKQSHQLQGQKSLLHEQSEQLKRLFEFMKHINASYEESMDKQKRIEGTISKILKQEIELEELSEQLFSLGEKMEKIEDYVNETASTKAPQLAQEAGQLKELGDKVITLKDDLEKKINILKGYNNTVQASQGLLEPQTVELQQHVTELQKQNSVLQVQKDRLQDLTGRLESLYINTEENTKNIIDLNETLHEKLQQGGQAGDANALKELVTSANTALEKKMKNETTLLTKKLESQGTELSSKLQKQASLLQKQGAELQQHSDKLKEFLETVKSVNARLESNTKDIQLLNKKHAPPTLKNVALRKPATMSSQYSSYSPDHAVDGGHNAYIQYCFHTLHNEALLWWMVDLQGFYQIFSVVITNRQGLSGKNMRDFEAQVFRQNPAKVSNAHHELCYRHPGSMQNGATEEYVCAKPLIGRYVRVAMNNSKPPRPLHLCEVEVWAIKAGKDACAPANKYSVVKGHKSDGDLLREETSASSAAQCVEWCNTDMRCNAVTVGHGRVSTSDKWSVNCHLLSMGGIRQNGTSTADAHWDLYVVADA